ncbi:transporter substrate-binding domain-containing protein [Brevibacillus sp. B_LB10_24]|uniref:transporter substrate-binding domain-containing protein n=1 Tax=Brevibacillus sp. B_LB10_24 TaxID=3380645 RepID=UPI0038BC5551
MKRYRQTIALLLSTVLLFALTACGQGNAAEGDAEKKVLRVGTKGTSYPWSLKNEKGELDGYDMDVTRAIAEKLGYTIEWTTADFTGLLGQLDTGRIDVIAEHTAVTDQRKEKYYFSDAYAYPDVQLIVKKDNDTYKQLSDLKGKKLAVALGSFYEEYVRKQDPNQEITIVTYEDTGGILNDIDLGRIDAYINDRFSGVSKIEKSGLPLKMSGETIVKYDFAFPFAKTEAGEKLRDDFNKALKELREEGKLAEFGKKWFKEDISTK